MRIQNRSVIILFLVALWGCGEETNTTQVLPGSPGGGTYFDKMATLQGALFDATTGQRIGGTDLKMTMIQGMLHRAPEKIITDTADPLVGEYVFTNVPISLNLANNIFKVVVTKPGYQRFEGLITFNAGGIGGMIVATSMVFIDANFNFLRNIYLFPVGQQASDIKIAVEFGNEPVVGATVLLQQNANENVPITDESSRLVAAPGMLASLSGTTDAEGKITFSGSTLVLGGAYTPVVLPIVHEGTRLEIGLGNQIIVGAVTPSSPAHTQLIALRDLEPGNHSDGLHVVFASNRDPGDVTGTAVNPGRLTLRFNRSIDASAIASTSTPFTATLVTSGGAKLNNPGALGSVTATLLDSVTLQLDPVFAITTSTTTPVLLPTAADKNSSITYVGGNIRVSGDEGATWTDMKDLTYLDGSSIKTIVRILGP